MPEILYNIDIISLNQRSKGAFSSIMKFILKMGIWICILSLMPVGIIYSQDFIIAGIKSPPLQFREDSKIQGINIEILDLISKKTGISFTYEIYDSVPRLFHQLKTGSADMTFQISRNADRMTWLTYPEESYINLSWNFFILRKNRGKIKYESFQDLKGLVIGIVQEVSYTPEFLNSGLKFDISTKMRLQLKKLLAGRFDAAPLTTINTLYIAKKQGVLDQLTYLPKPVKSKPYYAAFSKASKHPLKAKLFQQYDHLIQKMKEDGTIIKIYEKYLGKGYQL